MQPTTQAIVAAVFASGVTSVAFSWLFGEVSRARERREKRNELLGIAVLDLLSTRKKLLLASAIADEMHIFLEVPREAAVPFLPNLLTTYFKIDDSVHQRYERAGELLAATDPALAADLRGRTHLLKGMSVLAEVLPNLQAPDRAPYVVKELAQLKSTTLPMIDAAIVELSKRQGRRIARSVRATLRKPFELTVSDRANLRSICTIAKMWSEAESAQAASSALSKQPGTP
jgi:hypothetical protein